MDKSPDTLILETALKVMSVALDNLVGACLDVNGNPQAPEKKAIMAACKLLPSYCHHSLSKEQKRG